MKVALNLGGLRAVVVTALFVCAGVWGQNISWYTDNIEADTFYISSADQLRGLARIVNGTAEGVEADNFFRRTIVLNIGINLNTGGNWVPIGTSSNTFRGTFDGNGREINNMTIAMNGLDYGGLFGYVGANGVIKNLGVSGTISGVRYFSGGIVGYLAGRVENCYFLGSISSSTHVGGIAGSVVGGVLSNCYSTASVSGSDTVGGIAGRVGDGAILQYCAALNLSVNAVTTMPTAVGRVVGHVSGELLGNTAYNAMGGNATLRGTSQGAIIDTVTATQIYLDPTIGGRFSEENGWVIADDRLPGLFYTVAKPAHLQLRLNSAGSGSSDDPYMIYTAAQLTELARLVNAGDSTQFANRLGKHFDYKLGGDINLGVAPYNIGRGWTPIGTAEFPFGGNFDGGGHKITGLYINNDTLNYVGLFGYVREYRLITGVPYSPVIGPVVENLELEDVNITGNNNVGGAVGRMNASIRNVRVSGSVAGINNVGGLVGHYERIIAMDSADSLTSSEFSGSVGGIERIGGIVGLITGGAAGQTIGNRVGVVVAECRSSGEVLGLSDIGGLVGEFGGSVGGSVIDSYSSSSVSGTKDNIGGVVGTIVGNIENSYSTGDVEGSGNNIGGVAGTIVGNIENSYSTGDVEGGGDNIGGIAGSISGRVKSCYSTSAVKGGVNNIGGVVGFTTGSVENCYSVGAVEGNGNNIGGIVGELGTNGSILQCAALNPSVKFGLDVGGRVAGVIAFGSELSGNIAFDSMTNTAGNVSWPNLIKNGAGISAEIIHYDNTIGGLFTGAPWTLADSSLPGLFGNSVDMPAHLVYTVISVLEKEREIVVNTGAGSAVIVAPASSRPDGEFSAGPNPAVIGPVGFYRLGGPVRGGSLTVYDAAGYVVKKIDVVNGGMDDTGRRRVASWDLTDRSGRPVPAGTYLVKGVVITNTGKREKVSSLMGVR